MIPSSSSAPRSATWCKMLLRSVAMIPCMLLLPHSIYCNNNDSDNSHSLIINGDSNIDTSDNHSDDNNNKE